MIQKSTSLKYESPYRSEGNMAHIRQSWPDSGLGFQVKVLKPFSGDPSSLGSGIVDTIHVGSSYHSISSGMKNQYGTYFPKNHCGRAFSATIDHEKNETTPELTISVLRR